jgi:hypothetical protein
MKFKKGKKITCDIEKSIWCESWQIGADMLINFVSLFISGIVYLTFELRIFKEEYGRGRYAGSHLQFVVLDSNKSTSYPSNFVSKLPMRIDSDGKIPSAFTKLFGNNSLEIARGLLTVSLKKEHDSEIKAEIERRLNLLEPSPVIYVTCRVCRQFFKTHKEKARNQKICPGCIKRFRQKKLSRNV